MNHESEELLHAALIYTVVYQRLFEGVVTTDVVIDGEPMTFEVLQTTHEDGRARETSQDDIWNW